ncbi:hypothetical protein [Streptomyces sp. NPDC094032]|uniref:hypothetical protein n=1 Tax=Streptomyces sp. NPDC094032 TaxID=3155308 RepID=UPI00332B849B
MTQRRTYAALTAAALALPLLTTAPADAAPRTGDRHYVDCSATAPGDGSVQRPWTTLTEANAHPYGPGDSLLFKRGTTCTGTLAPQGAGAPGTERNGVRLRLADYGAARDITLDHLAIHDAVEGVYL